MRSQITSAVNTIDKDYIPNVRLNTSKLCEDLKERNVNISDIHLLNIGKTPNLDIHLLKTASSALNEIDKEADELSKHHRTKTLYQKAIGWLYYIIYTITGLIILYVTMKCSLISKCIGVLKLCCVKEGCVQYFYKCFNNNVETHSSRPDSHHVVTFSAIPDEEIKIDEITQDNRTQKTHNEKRRSRSRNSRLTSLN